MALVSVAIAAKELGVARTTLYSLIRKRAIPCVKIGDRVMLNMDRVLDALEIPAIDAESATKPLVLRSKDRS